jgi:hypothetical protein
MDKNGTPYRFVDPGSFIECPIDAVASYRKSGEEDIALIDTVHWGT